MRERRKMTRKGIRKKRMTRMGKELGGGKEGERANCRGVGE